MIPNVVWTVARAREGVVPPLGFTVIGPSGAEFPAVMPQVYHTWGRLTWRDARGVRPGVCM